MRLLEEINKIIELAISKNPYKKKSNHSTYSQYNEGWQDACEFIENELKKRPPKSAHDDRGEGGNL